MTRMEGQWRWLLDRADLSPKVREMIAAAGQRLQLRRLFPYMSLECTLKFSAATEYPYSEGFPYIRYVEPWDSGETYPYEVRDRDLRPTTFATLDAALDFVVDRMPELTGPGGVILWKAHVRYALSLDEVEQAAVTMLLAGDHDVYSVLRAQITLCTGVDRTFFGGGFSMSFFIPSHAPRVKVADEFVLGDVCAEIDGLQGPASFTLTVKDGLLSSLECRTRGET